MSCLIIRALYWVLRAPPKLISRGLDSLPTFWQFVVVGSLVPLLVSLVLYTINSVPLWVGFAVSAILFICILGVAALMAPLIMALLVGIDKLMTRLDRAYTRCTSKEDSSS